MIEKLIQENTEAIKALTAAFLAQTSKPTLTVVTDEQEPEAPAPEPTTDLGTPTKVAAPKRKAATTPSVPAVQQDSNLPPADEHVDVDETIAQINALVKSKMMSGNTADVKAQWASIRGAYGVERVSDLRDEPAKLLQLLAKAKAL